MLVSVPGERIPTSILDYDLDPGRVAREPASPRDAARMMVVHRSSDRVEHRLVRDLPEYLRSGDLLVVNATHVMPARLKLRRLSDGRLTEGLLESPRGDGRWHAFLLHAKRFRAGDRFELLPPEAPGGSPQAGGPSAVVHLVGRVGELVEIAFEDERGRSGGGHRGERGGAAAGDGDPAREIVSRSGWTPLPPYIRKARALAGAAESGDADRRDRVAYQTVYAKAEGDGSIAAPTAGLHFTPELLWEIERRGVCRTEVMLRIGPGTFKPVETDYLDDHPIHSERVHVPARTLSLLREAESQRRIGAARVVAVGTTSVRALESLPEPAAWPTSPAGWSDETSLMILPTTPIRRVDVLLTNFHLPRSSLMSLVAAFTGIERLRHLYDLAQQEGYRFYSFGDAMLIL